MLYHFEKKSKCKKKCKMIAYTFAHFLTPCLKMTAFIMFIPSFLQQTCTANLNYFRKLFPINPNCVITCNTLTV